MAAAKALVGLASMDWAGGTGRGATQEVVVTTRSQPNPNTQTLNDMSQSHVVCRRAVARTHTRRVAGAFVVIAAVIVAPHLSSPVVTVQVPVVRH